MKLQVTDEDEEVNSEVKFTLVDDHQIFAIYNPTGEIVTLREIASINTDTIYIRVIATDENGMGRSTYLNMKVKVLFLFLNKYIPCISHHLNLIYLIVKYC